MSRGRTGKDAYRSTRWTAHPRQALLPGRRPVDGFAKGFHGSLCVCELRSPPICIPRVAGAPIDQLMAAERSHAGFSGARPCGSDGSASAVVLIGESARTLCHALEELSLERHTDAVRQLAHEVDAHTSRLASSDRAQRNERQIAAGDQSNGQRSYSSASSLPSLGSCAFTRAPIHQCNGEREKPRR